MFKKEVLFVFLSYLLISCSSSKEAFMPFRNMAYSGQSLLQFKKMMLIGYCEYGLTMVLQLIG